MSDDNDANASSSARLPWDRRLYRQLIMKTTSLLGLAVQVLFVAAFTCVTFISELKLTGLTEIRQIYLFSVLLALWIVLGLTYEYAVYFLGRSFYVKWVGWKGICSSILYLLCGALCK